MTAKENTDRDVVQFRKKWKAKQAGHTGTRFKEPMTDSEMSVNLKASFQLALKIILSGLWECSWSGELRGTGKQHLRRKAARERNVRRIFWTTQISRS